MQREVELLVGDKDGRRVLRAPEVGRFTCALDRSNLVSPGARAGMIRTLGETVSLVVPRGVFGRVANDKPERVHEPVGYGDVLYELEPLEGVGDAEAQGEGQAAGLADGSVFRAPHSGRFWHRPAPGDPAFVEAGTILEPGKVVGLVEVMKTFTHLAYAPGDALPERARVVRVLVGDGDEVSDDDPLLEVEPA